MSALVLEPRVARGSNRVGAQAAQLGGRTDLGGEPTLDTLVSEVWEGLRAHAIVECPVCQEGMAPQYGVHARAIGGRCSTCGSSVR